MTHYVTRRRAMLALLLGAILAWFLWPDHQWVRVQQLRAELNDQSLTPEARRAKFEQLRTESAKLSPDQRARLAAEGQRRFQEDLARYFALGPAEKKRYLDERIDRGEQMRRQMQANGPPPGPPGGGQPRGPQSPEDRERRRQQRLNSSTPEFRAQMDQFRKDMEQRRQQRGLPATSGFGGRGR